MIIAIDGTASSGKGTLARRVGAHYGLPHLDTGLLYRAVGRRMLDAGRDLADASLAEETALALDAAWLDDPRLRSGEAGVAASRVAVLPGVRAALLAFQRDFAASPGGAVLDGRDIGTVIAPGADVKIWVTAAPEIRARRRWLELSRADPAVTERTILDELIARDSRDAPNMVRAPDSHLLDTSDLAIDEAFRAAIRIVEGRG